MVGKRRDPILNLRSTTTSTKTVYVIPGFGGHVLPYRRMAKFMDDAYSVKGLFLPRWIDGEADPRTIEGFAAYTERHLQPDSDGVLRLMGYSAGGLIAFETARRLIGTGCRVDLILFDAECQMFGADRPSRWTRLCKRAEYAVRRAKYALKGDHDMVADLRIKAAAYLYQPHHLEAEIVLVRPDTRLAKQDRRFEPKMGWDTVTNGVELIHSAGRHGDAFKGKNAEHFAVALEAGFEFLDQRRLKPT